MKKTPNNSHLASTNASNGAGLSLRLHAGDEDSGANPNFFHGLHKNDVAELRAVSSLRDFACGDMVFRQGEVQEGIFIILSGRVRVYYVGPSGRELTLAYWTEGNFIGGPEIFGGCLHTWSGQAQEPARLLFVPGESLRALIEVRPRIALALIHAMVHKGRCFSSLIQILGTRSAAERLAQLLLLMAEMDGQRIGDRLIINRALTQDELARMVGATRQWVSATLERFREKGLVEATSGRIAILDEQRLRTFHT